MQTEQKPRLLDQVRNCMRLQRMSQDIVLPRLQRILGHYKIETTMIYVHLITPSKVDSPLDHRPVRLVA